MPAPDADFVAARAHMLLRATHDPLGRDLTIAAGDLKKARGMVW